MTQQVPNRAVWMGFAAVTATTFMNNLDSSIVSVALPVMGRHFNVSVTALQWVINAYLLTITAFIPVLTRVADFVQRKYVWMGGIVVFLVGSVLCAVSPSYWALVAARGLQGVGGSAMVANSMAMTAMLFPPERRGRAMGLTSSVIAMATIVGPPVGGFLTSWLGWPSIFWINIPVGIWALLGGWRHLPKSQTRVQTVRLDWLGAALFVGSVAFLQISLFVWHKPLGWVLGAAALASIGGFVRRELRVDHPLIPLRVLGYGTFGRNLLSGLFYRMVTMFPLFLMPLYLGGVLHLGEATIGLIMMVQALGLILSSPLAGWLTDRIGAVIEMRIGLFCIIAGNLAGLLLSRGAPQSVAVLSLFLTGIGMGFFNPPNQAQTLNGVPPEHTGTASGLSAIQRMLGRSLGISATTITMSVLWEFSGVGYRLTANHARYDHWFLLGLHGSYATATVLAIFAVGLVWKVVPMGTRTAAHG